jgi:DNA invertase Pin-like site-specific DNA recombinase
MQLRALKAHAGHRGWTVTVTVRDVGSGASERPQRELLIKMARRREIDAVLVWRLDRWGRSLSDLVVTLKELGELGVGFVSLTEALDLTTPTGRAMAGLLAVFAEFERDILRARVRAGLDQARREGRQLGRPKSAALKVEEVRELHAQKVSKAEIARRLSIGRTSVRRLLSRTGCRRRPTPMGRGSMTVAP